MLKEDSRSFYGGRQEFENWKEEVLKLGKISIQTQIKSFERYIQGVLMVLIQNTQSEIRRFIKYILKEDSRSFISGMQEIQEL